MQSDLSFSDLDSNILFLFVIVFLEDFISTFFVGMNLSFDDRFEVIETSLPCIIKPQSQFSLKRKYLSCLSLEDARRFEFDLFLKSDTVVLQAAARFHINKESIRGQIELILERHFP